MVAGATVVGAALRILRMKSHWKLSRKSSHVTCCTLFEVGNYHSLKAFEEKLYHSSCKFHKQTFHQFALSFSSTVVNHEFTYEPLHSVDLKHSGNTFSNTFTCCILLLLEYSLMQPPGKNFVQSPFSGNSTPGIP